MRAVAYRVRADLALRRLPTLALCVVIAVVVGAVLAFAAGALRTATAPDRYQTRYGEGFDAQVTQYGGTPRTSEIAAMPGVDSADSVTFVFGGLQRLATPAPLNALIFSGTYGAVGLRRVAGRDPEASDEFVADRTFVSSTKAAVGDRFVLKTLTQEQADKTGFNTKVPPGPTLQTTLVGIVDGPSTLDDPSARAIFPVSFLAEHPRTGIALTMNRVGLRPGTDLGRLRSQVAALSNGRALSVRPAVLVSEATRGAVDTQTRGVLVLTLIAGIAAIVTLGQMTTRQVRLRASERLGLVAMGFTSRQIDVESIAKAGVPIVLGVVASLPLAYAFSTFFPFGFARRIEPQPGMRLDVRVLALGGPAMCAALLLWAVVSVTRNERVRPRPTVVGGFGPSAGGFAPPSVATGIRFARLPREGGRGSSRGVLVALAMICAVLTGTLTFASGLNRLLTDPARYGSNFDFAAGAGEEISDDTTSMIERDPAVATLTLYADGTATVDSQTLEVVGMEHVRGAAGPVVLAGRLPETNGEIALGRVEAGKLGLGLGDEVRLRGEGGDFGVRVTGVVVVPSIGSVTGVGRGSVLTMATMKRLIPQATPTIAAITFRTRLDRASLRRFAERIGSPLAETDGPVGSLPATIENIGHVRSIPVLLAILLAALGLATVLLLTLTSVRHRDLAILRSLGATRGWTTRVSHAQAVALAIGPLLFGTMMGVVGGRATFRVLADSVGVVPDPSTPFVVLGAVALGVLVTAHGATFSAARRVRRVDSIRYLRAE